MHSTSIERGSLAFAGAMLVCVVAAAAAVLMGLDALRASLDRGERLAETERALAALHAGVALQTRAVLRRALLPMPTQEQGFDGAARAIDRELNRLIEAPAELQPDIALMVEALNPARAQLQVAMQRAPEEIAAVIAPAREVDPFLVYEWRLEEVRSALAQARDANLAAGRQGAAYGPGAALGAAAAIALLLLAGQRRLSAALRRPIAALIAATDGAIAGQQERGLPESGPREFLPLHAAIGRMTRALAQSRAARLQSETQAALGALVPVVAHNIRNPLASIRAAAQLVEGEAQGEARETLAAIIATVDRLESWLSSLLSYLNPRQMRFALVRAADALRGARALVPQPADGRAARVEFGAIDDTAIVWGDQHLLEQATYALLANAIEASPANGSVTLGVKQGRGESAIVIDDQGPGMPFVDPPEVGLAEFAPGPTTKALGTGLGVPFARRVAELHGGRLTFERRPQGGTRATILIPHAPPADWGGPTDASV